MFIYKYCLCPIFTGVSLEVSKRKKKKSLFDFDEYYDVVIVWSIN